MSLDTPLPANNVTEPLLSHNSLAEVHSLVSPKGLKLNGRLMVVHGWDVGSNRYKVSFAKLYKDEAKTTFKVKPENLKHDRRTPSVSVSPPYRPPIHVLLAVRLDDHEALFRAKQSVMSIVHQNEALYLVFAHVLGDDKDLIDEFDLFLRKAIVVSSREDVLPVRPKWFLQKSTAGLHQMSEMEQLSELWSMSRDIDSERNAWLMPFSANDMMGKVRIQYLHTYLRTGIYHKDEYRDGLTLCFFGKLIVTESLEYNPDFKTTDWQSDPVLGTKASLLSQDDLIDARMTSYSDYALHTSMLQRFLDATPPEFLSHPFSMRRLDRSLIRLMHTPLYDKEYPWTMIQYKRPYVVEEQVFERGRKISPDRASEEMPSYWNLARSRLRISDEVLARRFPNLTTETVAMWRLYFEHILLMWCGFDHKEWQGRFCPHYIDVENGPGFGQAIWEQIRSYSDMTVAPAHKAKMVRFLDRTSHSVKEHKAASKEKGTEELRFRKIKQTLPGGKIQKVHCFPDDSPGKHFSSSLCKISERQRLLPYEGRDPNVTSRLFCYMCHRPESNTQKLFLCGRCKMVSYCCRDCQTEDFPTHKNHCKVIKHLTIEVEQATNQIATSPANYIPGYAAESGTSPFESHAGGFGEYPAVQSYLSLRAMLAVEILQVARGEDNVQLWEVTLRHKLELLRLNPADMSSIKVGLSVPPILLLLNRDDDCFAFVRHHLRGDNENGDIVRSKPNEWIYPTEPGCRYDDFVHEVENASTNLKFASFLLSLCTIKMRIVAHHRARQDIFQVFTDTAIGSSLEEVNSVIAEFVVGDELELDRVADSRAQVDRLLDITHDTNPFLFRALLDPSTVADPTGVPGNGFGLMAVGTMSEAYIAIQDGDRPFLRTPGATARLIQFLDSRGIHV